MEIIFYRYGSICEPDLIEAFQLCGISVIEETTEMHQKSISFESRIRILGELILTKRPAFVFSINYFPHISEICEKTHTLYVALTVDCPVSELFHISIRNQCNRIFLFDYMQYLRIHPQNPGCIFYLPLAANTKRWDTIIAELTESDRLSYDCDLSFVGSLYTEKSPLSALPADDFTKGYIDGLVSSQLQVPDYFFLEDMISSDFISYLKQADPGFFHLSNSFENTDAYIAANYYLGMQVSSKDRIHTLRALGEDYSLHLYTRSDTSVFSDTPGIRCLGGVSTHIEMPKVFFCSKINLNITMRSIQSGLSQRIWDVLGCKGFLLTDYQSELPEHLTIGKDLDCYESLSELKEKIAYYLSHDDIRMEIAEHGYQTVCNHHTYIHRVYTILTTVFPQ